MIERHVYLHLQPAYREGSALQEVLARSRSLTALDSVLSLRVLTAADDHAASAWDVCLVISFESMLNYHQFRDDPSHREYVDQFLKPRVQVVKAWNFEE